MTSYPKLPPLKSSEIEWDPIDPVDPPLSSRGVFHAQTQRQPQDRSSKATRSPGFNEVPVRNPRIQTMSSIRSPSIKAIAYFVGISVHSLHLCLRMHPMHQTAECDCTWEHLSDEIDDAWINWMGFGCMILIMVSAFNAFFIMTRYGTHRHCSRNTTLWCPNEFVLTFFCIYSPAHAVIWQVTTSANWMSMFVIMALISKQMSLLAQAYRMIGM